MEVQKETAHLPLSEDDYPLHEFQFKDMFKETLNILALRIPQGLTGTMLKRLDGFLVSRRGVKVVIPDDLNSRDNKKVLLTERITDPGLGELPEELRSFVLANAEVTHHTLHLGYEHYTADQALRRILPRELPVCTSFETVGHIAHLNLRDGHLPYRRIIGQVILDKNPRIRTVVNKTKNISTVYRTFEMEIIAGEENLNTEVSESKCRFRFNFGEVYWNSRLQHEHDRLVGFFRKDDVICDMFAGVGPFAIPAARNAGCVVYANDLNPKSYRALCDNVELNKVRRLVHCYNMDARDFVRKIIHESAVPISHVIMNLPASAELFLDVFKGSPAALRSPTMHCYMFTSAENTKEDVIKRIEAILECALNKSAISIHEVRDVSAKKRMMCASFPLPAEAKEGGLSARSISVSSGVWNNAQRKRKGPEEASEKTEKEEETEEEEGGGDKEKKKKIS